MHLEIKVAKLNNLFLFFAEEDESDAWGSQVTEASVQECIAAGRFEQRPFSESAAKRMGDYDHAARIAYLVVNKDVTPIEIDVGCPSLGYHEIHLVDGNHRAAAAIIRKDKTIAAVLGGEVSYMRHLFVRKNPRY